MRRLIFLAFLGVAALFIVGCQQDASPVGNVALAPPKPRRITNRPPDTEGGVVILMYHKFAHHETRYDRSFDHFRRDLERLYELGFRPVTMSEYLEDRMDLPPGASPVVFTFDDAAESQFQLKDDHTIDPDCAVGIWKTFEKTHPDFPLRATWYVLPGVMWGQRKDRNLKVAMLQGWGSELGSHTWDHPMLNRLPDEQIKREIGKSIDFLERYGYTKVSFAYPYGLRPKNKELIKGFDWRGKHYSVTAAVSVDTDLAPPPSGVEKRRYKLQRIEAIEGFLGFDFWMDLIERGRKQVYVQP